MKYQAIPSDDGRWFVYDAEMDVVFAYVSEELIARKVARMLNQTPGQPLDDQDPDNPAIIH